MWPYITIGALYALGAMQNAMLIYEIGMEGLNKWRIAGTIVFWPFVIVFCTILAYFKR